MLQGSKKNWEKILIILTTLKRYCHLFSMLLLLLMMMMMMMMIVAIDTNQLDLTCFIALSRSTHNCEGCRKQWCPNFEISFHKCVRPGRLCLDCYFIANSAVLKQFNEKHPNWSDKIRPNEGISFNHETSVGILHFWSPKSQHNIDLWRTQCLNWYVTF